MSDNNRRSRGIWMSVLAMGGLLTGCTTPSTEGADTTIQTSSQTSSQTSADDDGTVFDASTVHTFEIDIDDDAVRELLETYTATGEKDWATASVIIDGETFEDVGVRLKGNSSLRDVDPDVDPADLPWLIRLDKYVDGQNLDGYSEFIVRSNNTQTSLNEAVALDLLEEAGLASEQAVAARFSVSGGSEQLRLVVQNLDETWEEDNFDTVGALYKAESTGDYSYRGDDPDAYEDVFDQETGDTDDLGPVIELLDFVNNSSDEEFAAELADWLDVESFATYLAFENLVDNFDDIDGPGNNSYLRWDADAEQLTVVAWDHNLAFGVQNGAGGGAGRGPGVGMDAPPAMPDGAAAGGQPSAADGARPVPGAEQAVPGAARAMPGVEDNPLVERFLEVSEFSDQVSTATAALTAELFSAGVADDVLQTWVDALEQDASDLVDETTLTAEAEAIAAYFTSGQ